MGNHLGMTVKRTIPSSGKTVVVIVFVVSVVGFVGSWRYGSTVRVPGGKRMRGRGEEEASV